MNKARVLLADDHAVVRAGIRNAIGELDSLEIVGEVGDGPSLEAALVQLSPDCLLIDVAMPQFEPVSAIQKIRARYPDMKILVISAYDDDVYVQGLLGAGVHGYHLKDQPLSDMRLAVQRVLAGERWVSSPLIEKLLGHGKPQVPSTTLTSRQREILRHLQQGQDNKTIARQTGLSVKTIENHLTRIYRQLDVQSRLEAVNYVLRHPELLGLRGQQPQSDQRRPTTEVDGAIRILVVDDNARYRSQLRRMASRVCTSATIYEAGDTAEAVRLARMHEPQLVLVDMILGDENGIGCTRRLRQAVPQARIILISAYPDREFHRLGIEAGALAFLDKRDLDASALRQIVDDAASPLNGAG